MVAVIIIAVLFTGISIAVAYGASRGSFKTVGDALQTTNRSSSRLLNATLAVVFIGVGIVVPLVFIIGERNRSDAQVNGIHLTAAMQSGRELFAEHCGTCHMLAATDSVGKVGPNLDVLRPSEATVVSTIAHGCVQQAPNSVNTCLGFGTMPAGLVQGRQAQEIAEFVAHVAGRG